MLTCVMKKILLLSMLIIFLLTHGTSFSQTSIRTSNIAHRVAKTHSVEKAIVGALPSQYLEVQGMKFISKSYTLRTANQEDRYLGNEQVKEVFFTIIFLTDKDGQALDVYSETGTASPVLCKGNIKTQELSMDYLARVNCKQEHSAIINGRKFNLLAGQTILVAPQKDKSTRFLQLKSPGLNSLTASTYIEKLLTKEGVMSFFGLPGNI